MYRPLADDGIVRRLLGAAAAAPSIHNTQPWRFRIAGHDLVEVHGDPDRMLWVADPRGRALHLSCGAALLNLRLAIRATGAKPLVWPLPDPAGEPTLLASVQLAEGRPPDSAERELFESIGQRHTSRAPFSGSALPAAVCAALEQAADAEFALLRHLPDGDAALVTRLAAAADKELAENFDHRVELCRWIGTDGDDGVPATALGSQPDHDPAPVRDFGYASPMTPRPSGSYEPLPHLAVLATAHDEPADWLRAGQALQRVLLTATVHGVTASLLYQPIELHDIRQPEVGWWPWPECPQIVIRFGYGPPGPGTPRRPVEDILDRAAAAGDGRPASHR
jgi:nitroreductase